MSNLNAFLNPVAPEQRREVMVSNRFLGEDGAPVPFVIRPLSQGENETLLRRSTHTVKNKGQLTEKLNDIEYNRRLVVAATVEPDFADGTLCQKLGVMDPLEAPGKLLLVGEYNRLAAAIMELSGLNDDLEEQAKN